MLKPTTGINPELIYPIITRTTDGQTKLWFANVSSTESPVFTGKVVIKYI